MRRRSGAQALGLALAGMLAGCASLPAAMPDSQRHFRSEQTNHGPERYASWFGDSDGRVFYFGLSPFNTLAIPCEAEGGALCPLRDREQPGDHLIGRFDLERERFLEPLVVRPADPAATSSVWDVLVHSNGRIYYTTFWDEFGSLRGDGSDLRHHLEGATGLNELWEGPGGEIFATRYLGERPGVVVFGPDGALRREYVLPQEDGVLVCPKSLAVDPRTGEIWINSDAFRADGRPAGFPSFRLSAAGEVLERSEEPALAFLSFDAEGRGWFVDDDGSRWTLRIVPPEGPARRIDLGPHAVIDTVQDVKHHGNLTLLATWQQRVFVVRSAEGGRFDLCELAASPVADCPQGGGLGYTAVAAASGGVYESVDCGILVVRAGDVDECRWSEVGE
jgi:hypothetical protein